MTPPIFTPTEFMAFVLILARVAIIIFIAPIFGGALVPNEVKAALSLLLTLVLWNTIGVDVSAYPVDLIAYAPMLATELFVGLTITLLIRMVLEGVQIAGQYIGYQMGFAIVNVVDPQSGEQASVLAQIMYVLALIVFLSVNGHYIIIKGMVDSFELVPPGQLTLSPVVYSEIMGSVSGMFIIALKLGAPALAVMFFTKVSMGIVAKTVPQMNILFVGMPLYIVIGLFVFGLSLNFFVPLLGRVIIDMDSSVATLLKAM